MIIILSIDEDLLTIAEKWQNEAKTVSFFSDSKQYFQCIAVSDRY